MSQSVDQGCMCGCVGKCKNITLPSNLRTTESHPDQLIQVQTREEKPTNKHTLLHQHQLSELAVSSHWLNVSWRHIYHSAACPYVRRCNIRSHQSSEITYNMVQRCSCAQVHRWARGQQVEMRKILICWFSKGREILFPVTISDIRFFFYLCKYNKSTASYHNTALWFKLGREVLHKIK